MRIKNVKIDSIYVDKKGINLIYASKKYLSTMSVNSSSIAHKNITQTDIIELVTQTIA